MRIEHTETSEVPNTMSTELYIDNGPITSIVRKGGHWVIFNDGTGDNPENDHMKCSECGQYWSDPQYSKVFKYCFNCGAEMDLN